MNANLTVTRRRSELDGVGGAAGDRMRVFCTPGSVAVALDDLGVPEAVRSAFKPEEVPATWVLRWCADAERGLVAEAISNFRLRMWDEVERLGLELPALLTEGNVRTRSVQLDRRMGRGAHDPRLDSFQGAYHWRGDARGRRRAVIEAVLGGLAGDFWLTEMGMKPVFDALRADGWRGWTTASEKTAHFRRVALEALAGIEAGRDA